jgi:hypothetical protein
MLPGDFPVAVAKPVFTRLPMMEIEHASCDPFWAATAVALAARAVAPRRGGAVQPRVRGLG